MTIELPVFRLGFGGFSPIQEQVLVEAVRKSAAAATQWLTSELPESDAWFMNGARVQVLGEQRVRVGAGTPGGKSVQLYLPDVDRPVAFSEPISTPQFQPSYTFDATAPGSMDTLLAKIDAWLAPLSAQFCLASHIVEHQTALGAGIFEVHLNGSVAAMVDLHGAIGVLPTLGPSDLDQTVWQRRAVMGTMPENFVRTDLSMLMWNYSLRSQRDLLPRHYRAGPLYFRRPPRVAQRLLKDSHLLIMRELAHEPTSFATLLKRTGLAEADLSHALATLYLVGTVTSNPKRAVLHQRPQRKADEHDTTHDLHSGLPSILDSVPPAIAHSAGPAPDLTAPAPLRIS
jgi:hypothetical protein